MKLVVEERPDIAFYIKMLPLDRHPGAYEKAKTIVCEQSLWTLERALDGKQVREPRCETDEIERTKELARRLGITGTPTTILPDGGIVTGFKDKNALIGLIDKADEEKAMAEEDARRRAFEEAEALRRMREAQDAQAEGLRNTPVSPTYAPEPSPRGW
jgi:thiol:disulfide interchange protein DsbC